MDRECYECLTVKNVKSFPFGGGGSERLHVCGSCLRKRERQAHPEKFRVKAAKVRREKPWRAVIQDCRKADRRRGHEGFDLTTSFVKSLLLKGCSYCEAPFEEIRITLDRVDNQKGHTQNNVVPACIRCNYTRGSMPYQAWLFLVPRIKEAYDKGLFGDWRSQPINRGYTDQELDRLPRLRDRPGVPKGTRTSRQARKSDNFPPVEEVRARVEASSLRVVAEQLGCSHVSVWKYLKSGE